MNEFENNNVYDKVVNVQERKDMIDNKVVGIGEWLVALLVMSIPCLNIIMMFVWAFSGSNKSKQNYFKAYLIFIGIIFAIVFLLYVFVFAALIASGSYY